MPFDTLGLSENVLRAVIDAGYTEPTPIQAQAIPVVLMGKDVLGCAQTGTGKTAGFTLPMIEILSTGRARARMPRSLIIEPTRELAAQVSENFAVYGKYTKLTMALLIGGESFNDQERALDRGVDVLIATPGRLLDLMGRGKIILNDVKILVIDEADRMLDMGFIPDVESIVARLPRNRQTLFFSATMAPEIKRLADAFLDNPREISVAPPASPALTVTQKLVPVRPADKREALRSLLRSETVNNAILFCNRKRDVDILHKSLVRHGFNAAALHGDLPQHVRTDTLEKFKSGEIKLLVASDVAARGLDIVTVSHVFNFDVPIHAEDYVHRIGRTGRAGRTGTAFTLASSGDRKFLDAIEKLIGRAIPRIEVESMEPLDLDAPPSEEEAAEQRRGGRRGAPASRDGKSRSGDSRRRGGSAPREAAAEPRAVDVPVEQPEIAADERPARRSGRRSETERRPVAERQPEADQRPQPEPRLVHVNPRPPEDRSRRPRESEPESPLAFGDHMPAFMLRSLPIRKAS